MKKSYFSSIAICAILFSSCAPKQDSEVKLYLQNDDASIAVSAEAIHETSLVLDAHADIVTLGAAGQVLSH